MIGQNRVTGPTLNRNITLTTH